MSDLHDTIAAGHEKLRRGEVYCLECGRIERVDSAGCLHSGWPKCCGYTMSLDTPAERKRLEADHA